MDNLLSSYANSRDNNFNLIRFFAASLVLISHSFAIVIGTGEAEPFRQTIGMTPGTIAVDIFFITSGFLITGSYYSRQNVFSFIWARVLRIYPGLIIAMIFCTFGIGLFFTTYNWYDYITDTQTIKYLIKNSFLFFGVEHTLPGVFLDTPYKEAVNGSLWTLPYEVKMYTFLLLIIGGAAYISKSSKNISTKKILLLIGIASFSAHIINNFLMVFPEHFTRLFSMFFVGAAFYAWKDKISLSHKIILIAAPLLALSTINKTSFFLLYCTTLPFLIFYLAYIPGGWIRKFNNFGDYSYGIYIYAFPVQQSIISLIPEASILMMTILSIFFTLILSVLSWHLIEKKSLKVKNSYTYIESIVKNNFITKGFFRIGN